MQNPELALWRAVLVAGLHDAARGKDPAWLGSDDFAQVCDLAQLDPEAVLRCYSSARLNGLHAYKRKAA